MAVRRKSNWYIYLLAFAITMAFVIMVIFTFRWYLFPEKTEETGITSAGELSETFSPKPEHNMNIMVMMSDGAQDSPELFVLAAYNAVESRLTYIPVPKGISVSTEGRTLPNVYAAQGGEGVIDAFNTVTGVECHAYIKMDRLSFVDLVSSFGNAQYDVPKTVIINDGLEIDTINAGEQLFTAEMAYRYIMLADFDDSESYRFNLIGDLLAEMVNQNYLYADSSLLDTYAQLLMNCPETNVTQEFYNSRKAALLNTLMYGSSPAEYYVPYGEYSEDGEGFLISENSVTTIRQKAGLE